MVRPSLATVIVLVAIAALGFIAVAAVQRARTQGGTATAATQTERPAGPPPAARAARLRPLSRVEKASSAPARPEPVRWQILQVRSGHSIGLRSRPAGGKVLATVDGDTEFGSPTTLSVVKQRRGWLGVTSTLLPNGTLGWVKAAAGDFKAAGTRLAIRIDLSERRLQLVNGRRVVRSASVAVGRPGSSTPTGRF